MLKNIRLHLEKDEALQAKLEAQLASHILTTHKDNINAFMRNMPSVLPYVESPELNNYSVFINKHGQHNIVDYGMGRTFYGFYPEQEVQQQYQQISQHCPRIALHQPLTVLPQEAEQIDSLEQLNSVKRLNQMPPLPAQVDCLVVLGCGLGLHLKQLLSQHKIKNLLIYEPELQYFQCSVMTTAWQEIFDLAKAQGCGLFLQLEKDGRDLIDNIKELSEHFVINEFYLYKHYNHQVFDSLYQDLTERSWSVIQDSGFSIQSQAHHLDYLPKWTQVSQLDDLQLLTPPNCLLEKNLQALKRYFPSIYAEFKDYQPQKWLPVCAANGEVNLIKKDSLHPWYGDSPKQDCFVNFDNFNEQPNKDGLVLGYKGNKLAHYIHYQFVKETEELLAQAEEEVGALPDKVPSIILFGLGVGYQLEKLLAEHSVEKLFICEPNPDFFYASLFAIDWQQIFSKVEQSEARIYLNIGDDGTNLFRDLLSQFYSIGPYILNSTYFYQSYYNAALNSAITQLREQLQVVISMGEYFDHAYYGIAHTKEGMRRKIPILTANPASKLSYDDKEVPIFIVGNGPSLDSSIEAIKEWQGQAIVVSCGTALQALHRHGITPDFHAEIEQNRSTFDWAVLVGDLDYLKQITLISCNGIHPDTCELYKDVLVAFKEGESSTISALNILGRENFEILQNAFPTVSNYVCDLFSTIGFTSLYLIGVDLGFVDVKHHHSKSSGYYQEDGEETYNYAESANTSIIVPGNFRPTVNTKHEFKVSRQVIEQVTAVKPKGQEFYNCSDGAKIQGTLAIRPDDLLIVTASERKKQTIKQLKTKIFSTDQLDNYVQKFEQCFSQKILMAEMDALEALLEAEINSPEQVQQLINTQKEMLFDSYKKKQSLLFYYMYGTVNYANAVLTKLLSINNQDDSSLMHLSEAITKWQATIKQIKLELMNSQASLYDFSAYNIVNRELEYLKSSYINKKLLIVTDSPEIEQLALYFLTLDYPELGLHFCTLSESYQLEHKPDYCLYFLSTNHQSIKTKGQLSTLVVTNSFEQIEHLIKMRITCFVFPSVNEQHAFKGEIWMLRQAIKAVLNVHNSSIILPKYWATKAEVFQDEKLCVSQQNYSALDYKVYICLYHRALVKAKKSQNGTAGQPIHRQLLTTDLLKPLISEQRLKTMKKNHFTLKKSLLEKL